MLAFAEINYKITLHSLHPGATRESSFQSSPPLMSDSSTTRDSHNCLLSFRMLILCSDWPNN